MGNHDHFVRGKLRIITTGSGSMLAKRVVKFVKEYQNKSGLGNGHPILVDTREVEFGESEIKTEINESLRGADVYVIGDCVNSAYPHPDYPFTVDQNLRAVKSAISGASEANHITAVLPYFPYSRQDKRIAREGITAKDVARELELAGAKQVITFDIHNPATAGFFENAKLENLLASRNLIGQFRNDFDIDKLVICSPDAGGVKRAEYYCNHLGAGLAIIHKERDYKNGGAVKKMVLTGDVRGYDVLIVDDMAATCGTMEKALETLKGAGARSMSYAVTHAILNRGKRNEQGIPPKESGKDRIIEYHKKGILKRFYCADIIGHRDFFRKHKDFITPVPVDKYLAKVIHNLNVGESISALLDRNHQI